VLDDITPIILTLDEAPNIGRNLEQLRWAKDIVIVDSRSADATLSIAARHATVRVFQRPFDSHAEQWNFALHGTGIGTSWVLALDADYVLSDELVRELSALVPPADVSGYRARFVYCVNGKPLRASVYTPVTVLFRRDRSHYAQDGHTQRVKVEGKVEPLSSVIYHDDRKSRSRWVASQKRYMRIEAEKLLSAEWKALRWPERIRRLRVVAPFAMLFYCLFAKGLILDGRAGVAYSLQRAYAELLLSFDLIQRDLAGIPGLRRRG
jgi:glycosyltransferase involved in cell wall biosynthesis